MTNYSESIRIVVCSVESRRCRRHRRVFIVYTGHNIVLFCCTSPVDIKVKKAWYFQSINERLNSTQFVWLFYSVFLSFRSNGEVILTSEKWQLFCEETAMELFLFVVWTSKVDNYTPSELTPHRLSRSKTGGIEESRPSILKLSFSVLPIIYPWQIVFTTHKLS